MREVSLHTNTQKHNNNRVQPVVTKIEFPSAPFFSLVYRGFKFFMLLAYSTPVFRMNTDPPVLPSNDNGP